MSAVPMSSTPQQFAPTRRTRFIRETISYAFGVGSVAAIALIREVNLLVFITGLLLVPLLINSYLARASLWRITAKRRLPEGVCAGESCIVEIEVEHPRRMTAAWTLMLKDQFHLVEPLSLASFDAPAVITVLAQSKEPNVVKAAYRISANRRGRYRFGPLEASTRYPLGFVESRVKWIEEEDWRVLPRLGFLLPAWRMEVETLRQGEKKSHSRRGFVEGEFHGLRQWRDGDSRRWIHWRTSARAGRLMVRQFERQQNQDLILLLDPWSPLKGGLDDCAAVELAISFVATAIDDLCKQGAHRLCLLVNAQKPLIWTGVTSHIALEELLSELSTLEPTQSETELAFPDEFRSYAADGTPIIRVTSRRSSDPARSSSDLEAWSQSGEQTLLLNVRRGDLNPFFADVDSQT